MRNFFAASLLFLICSSHNAASQTSIEVCYEKDVRMLLSPDCDECRSAKSWLKENKIRLDEIDIGSDYGKQMSRSAMEKFGVKVKVPTVFFLLDSKIVDFSTGFDLETWKKKFCLQ